MQRFPCLVVAVVAAALLPAGCTPKSEKAATVSGTVNLDGQPMKEGEITFVPADGSAPTILPVQNGTFKGEMKVGKKRVEIRAYREGKAQTGGGMYKGNEAGPAKENYLPARFNDQSTLTAEVADSGVTPSTFDVQSR